MPMSEHLKLRTRATTAEGGKVGFETLPVLAHSQRGLVKLMGPGHNPLTVALDVWVERQRLGSRIRSFARPTTAAKLQAYLGSPYPVVGLSTPEIRLIHKEFQKTHPDMTIQEVNLLAGALWSGETLEEKTFAIGLLGRHAKHLDERSWALADFWVDEAIGWALSDGLASGPISAMVQAHPKHFADILRWTNAKNFWRRRASTYALNDIVRAGDVERAFRVLERLLYDEEFWVQRAVGTWLRECWKKDAKRTEAFLRKHVAGLPPVTITVATERASKRFRNELRRRSRQARSKA